MTLGQRICQKRKELGLSQETLGEQLGVSRQAIYKWESDGAVPEVEKLIALSQIFSVSVGWLLGVEDAAPETSEAAPELTDAQLAMVKEIVEQYLAAREEARPPRKVWPRVLAVLACAGLAIGLYTGYQRLRQSDYESMRGYVDWLYSSLSHGIDLVTEQMEDAFRENSTVAVDWQVEHLSSDPEAGTASFRVQATPRTYTPETTALFRAVSMGETVELAVAEPDGGNSFSGEITCPLTDDISLYVVFLSGDEGQTQLLEHYTTLYTDTFPTFTFAQDSAYAFTPNITDGVIPASSGNQGLMITVLQDGSTLDEAELDIRVGLFRDGVLMLWYDREIAREQYATGEAPFWNLSQEVVLEPGHTYWLGMIYTDELGRQLIKAASWAASCPDGFSQWEAADVEIPPADWVF